MSNAFRTIAAVVALILLASSNGGASELTPALLYRYDLVDFSEELQSQSAREYRILDNQAILVSTTETVHYQKPSGEWVTPPEPLTHPIASTNGTVAARLLSDDSIAIWYPESDDNRLAPVGGDNFGVMSVSNEGGILLLNADDTAIYYWKDNELRPLDQVIPAFSNRANAIFRLLTDGGFYGFDKPTPSTFAPFTLLDSELTVYPEYTLNAFHILDFEHLSANGNGLAVRRDEGFTVWGPSFENEISVDLTDFEALEINAQGAVIGNLDRPITASKQPLYWSFPYGFNNLNDLILVPEGTDPPLFTEVYSINASGSILAHGIVRVNPVFSIGKVYLLTRVPASETVDVAYEFQSNAITRLTALPHFETESLEVEGSDDLKNWIPINSETTNYVGPRRVFELSPGNQPAFLRVRAIRSSP